MGDLLKYRVWSTQTGQYITNVSGSPCVVTADGELHVLLFASLEDKDTERPATGLLVERCTGVRDARGTLIFEGDVVETKDGERGTVEWLGYKTGFGVRCDNWSVADISVEQRIVGNIHDKH